MNAPSRAQSLIPTATPLKLFLHILSRGLGAVAFAVLLGGCAAPLLIERNGAGASVRQVDFTETPELKDWAEHARRLGDELYPRLLALLTNETTKPVREFDIVFKKRLLGDNRGVAAGKTVYINAAYFGRGTNAESSYTTTSRNFDKILVHEMAHVATGRGFRFYSKKSPDYWSEGIADYARYKLGYTNGWGCPQCDDNYPHYTSGYSCAGALLLYIEAECGSNVVRQLADELRRGTYANDFFTKSTGKSIDDWWSDFQKTAFYKPDSNDAFRLQQALGYASGIPPKDLPQRALSYLRKSPGGRLTMESGEFLSKLIAEKKLPGVTAAECKERGFSLGLDPWDFLKSTESAEFPATRKWFGRYHGDANKNYYVVFRASKEQPWQLQEAWHADADGNLVEEYCLQ